MQITTLNQLVANEQSRDRISAAARAIVASQVDSTPVRDDPTWNVAIRRARQADAGALAQLASLDGRGHAFSRVAASWAADPELVVLLAEVEDEPAAALVVSSGTVLADPFQDTKSIVKLLEVRRLQLSGAKGFGRRLRHAGMRTLRA